MGRQLSALVAGIIFGLGLAISQMVNPQKVLNFLDVAGRWDPSLLFVLGGAVVVTFVLYRVANLRAQPVFAPAFLPPQATGIDARLLAGAVIFGIGWGLAGYCPGPGIASLAQLFEVFPGEALVFVAAMIVGSFAAELLPASAMPGRRGS